MDDKKIFDTFSNDNFTRDFTNGYVSEMGDSVTMINSYMAAFDSGGPENWTPEMRREFSDGVRKECCHIMQTAELYSRIYDVTFSRELTRKPVNMKNFFDSFTDSVQKSLEGTCVIELKTGSEFFASTNQKLLTYILLLYIRSAVINGAVNIKLSYAVKGSDLVIETMIVKKSEELRNNYPDDDFFAKYQSSMNAAFVEKLGGEIRETKKSMIMIFPDAASEKKSDLAMKEAHVEKCSSVCNAYNIMLSDLSDNLIFP